MSSSPRIPSGQPTSTAGSAFISRPTTAGRPVYTPAGTVRQLSGRMGTALIGQSGSARSSWGAGSCATAVQGVGLATSIMVADRPITQHGLGGLKTGIRPSQRQVQDKTYFLGLLRTKINEIGREITLLSREGEQLSRNQTSSRSYNDKRAANLALELKALQEELGDFNVLSDKLSTDTDTEAVRWECEQLRQNNDRESRAVEELFADRCTKDNSLALLEKDMEEEKRFSDGLIASMEPELQTKHAALKRQQGVLQQQIEAMQHEMDGLDSTRNRLEKEISGSHVKKEAVSLCEKLHELEEKKDALVEEEKTRGTPAQEREKLLKKVKEDNQEITMMERHVQELKDQINKANLELHHLKEDIDASQSERNQQYLELRKREQMMDQFLEAFGENNKGDVEKKSQLERNIVSLLETTSRKLEHFQQMPTTFDLSNLKEDLILKERELEKSKSTSTSLFQDQKGLIASLGKMNQLEDKIKLELESHKEKIKTMTSEMSTFADLDSLKRSSHAREKEMNEELQRLTIRRETIKAVVDNLSADQETLKKQLSENEAHIQLGNLERKWQHLEQNNFSIREFIETKKAETNYNPIVKTVSKQLKDYNENLQATLAKR